jgi:hypothetical protein
MAIADLDCAHEKLFSGRASFPERPPENRVAEPSTPGGADR